MVAVTSLSNPSMMLVRVRQTVLVMLEFSLMESLVAVIITVAPNEKNKKNPTIMGGGMSL